MKKVLWVGAIIVCVVMAYIVLTASMPAVTSMVEVAANATAGDNYTFTNAGVDMMPVVLYALPALIGLIAVVIVLKSK